MKYTDAEYQEIDDCLNDIKSSRNHFLFIYGTPISQKVILLGLAKQVNEYMSDQPPITFTEKGREVLQLGGYKKFEKKERNKRIYSQIVFILTVLTFIGVMVQIYQGYHQSQLQQPQQTQKAIITPNKDTNTSKKPK